MSRNQLTISNILKNHELRLKNIETNNNNSENSEFLGKSEIEKLMNNLIEEVKEQFKTFKNEYFKLEEKYNNLNELYTLQNLEFLRFKNEILENKKETKVVLEIEERNNISEVEKSANISDEVDHADVDDVDQERAVLKRCPASCKCGDDVDEANDADVDNVDDENDSQDIVLTGRSVISNKQ